MLDAEIESRLNFRQFKVDTRWGLSLSNGMARRSWRVLIVLLIKASRGRKAQTPNWCAIVRVIKAAFLFPPSLSLSLSLLSSPLLSSPPSRSFYSLFLLIAFACTVIVSCHSSLHADVVLYAVIGDFPAMERERATRGTNRGSPRGIPRKTRSHQDSWMLALCCTDLTYWPLQLPCTINRDPARSASYTKRKGGRGGGGEERERKNTKKRYRKGEEMWLVTL